jgi:hypothetical protein
LDLSNNSDLEEVIIYGNRIVANLGDFSHLQKVKKLFIGSKGGQISNNIDGSLKELKDCEDLEYLNIRGLNQLEKGLKHLPTINLSHFDCENTPYADTLRGFKTDVRYTGNP